MAVTGFGKLPVGGSRAWVALVLAALIALAVGAATAYAGTYVIDNCPSAPGGNGNAGPWTVFESPQNSKATCSGGPGDYIGPRGGSMSVGSFAGVRIVVPTDSDIAIREAKVWWYAAHQVSGADPFAVAFTNDGVVGESGTPLNRSVTPNDFTLPSPTTTLTLATYCSNDDAGNGCTFGGGVNNILQLFGAQLTLEDNSLPTGNVTGGGLAGSGTVSGTQALTYTASDPNSGVRAVDLLIDGDQVAQNDYGARCPYQNFLACPAMVSDSISWNTAGASAGSHEVALKIVSAAGDTTIVDDHEISIGNGSGPPPSSPSSVTNAVDAPICAGDPSDPGVSAPSRASLTARWANTSRRVLTSRYGAKARVTGRLTTSSGQPIAGASIYVCQTPAYKGAHTSTIASPRTGPTGAWSLTLPRNISSGTLRFAYRSQTDDTAPTATTSLTLRVHAGIALHIAPRITSVGRHIYFSGVVHGPIPPGGKQLILEASSGGEWIQFDTIRTNVQGRYRASYRFKFPGPVTYRFRVVSPFESGFPFLGGVSDGVVVREI